MTSIKSPETLKQHIEQLPAEIEPQRDLWQGIELSISGQKPPAKKPHKLIAIAAGLLIPAVLTGLMLFNNTQQNTGVEADNVALQLSRQFESQKQSLLVTYSDQQAVTDNWQGQLAELEEAAVAIKAALEHEPENMALLRMLQTIYQQQIDLIERVHAPKWQQI